MHRKPQNTSVTDVHLVLIAFLWYIRFGFSFFQRIEETVMRRTIGVGLLLILIGSAQATVIPFTPTDIDQFVVESGTVKDTAARKIYIEGPYPGLALIETTAVFPKSTPQGIVDAFSFTVQRIGHPGVLTLILHSETMFDVSLETFAQGEELDYLVPLPKGIPDTFGIGFIFRPNILEPSGATLSNFEFSIGNGRPIPAVPEPSTYWLLGLGAAILGLMFRRRKRR